MVNYRRVRNPGGIYFFTVTLQDRQSCILTENITPLSESFKYVKQRKPFNIDATVVLPEHIHCIWTLPRDDSDYSIRWRLIKTVFTQSLLKNGSKFHLTSKNEYQIWQRRYWEHTIQNDDDFRHHVEYIHFNPVKHDLVKCVADWRYSSFHQYVRKGFYPNDWGKKSEDFKDNYGE